MSLVMLGVPGSGKSTQAKLLSDRLNLEIISIGDIVRDRFSYDLYFREKFERSVAYGNLLPDDVIISVLEDILRNKKFLNGLILDGFPRTLKQAMALNDMVLLIDKVINVDVSDDVVLERIKFRRVCPKCKITYNLSVNPPKSREICDACGSKLVVRNDDAEMAVISNRLSVYRSQIKDLTAYYSSKKILEVVDGSNDIYVTFELILKAVAI